MTRFVTVNRDGNPLRKGESMEQRITEQLKTIEQNPSLVRAFFRHPSVAYITD